MSALSLTWRVVSPPCRDKCSRPFLDHVCVAISSLSAPDGTRYGYNIYYYPKSILYMDGI